MANLNTVFKFQDPEKKYTGRIPKSVWESFRGLITFLHKHRVTMLCILSILKVCTRFEPSMSQLVSQAGRWKLKVYKTNNAGRVTVARAGSLCILHTSITNFDRERLKHVRANSDSDHEAIISSIKASCEPDDGINAIVSLILSSDSIGSNAHIVLADIGQLLYACKLFFEARYVFCLSYEHLTSRTLVDYVSIAACERDRIRVSTSPRERQDVAKGEHFFMLTLGCKHCTDTCSDVCQANLNMVRHDITAAQGTPLSVDSQRFESSLPSGIQGSNSQCWMLRHSDLNWRWTASEHPYRVMEVARMLESWISNLHQESGRVWMILTDCFNLLKECCDTPVNPFGRYVSDIGDAHEFQRDSRILGCFFATSYLRRVSLQNSTTRFPLAEVLRLERITSFNLTIRLYSVFATWIVESAMDHASGPVSAHPAKALLEAAQFIRDIEPGERASKFLELDRKIWYNNYYIDYTTPEPWKRAYIVRTAKRMAEVLIELQKSLPRYHADPVLGKRDRSWASSTASCDSAREMQELARKIRKQRKSGEVSSSILRLSDRMSDMTIDSKLSFGAVTGYPPKIPSMYSLSDTSSSHLLSSLPGEYDKLPDLVSVHEVSAQ